MFSHLVRVYWEDTDAGGIVFYANHLKFMERARTEWLRTAGIQQHQIKADTGGMFVVTAASMRYHLPARLDDLLIVSVRLLDKGRASMAIEQDIRLQCEPQRLLCSGTINIAWVDATSLKPGRIPTSVLEALV